MDGLFTMMVRLLRVIHLVKMIVDLKVLDLPQVVQLQVNQVQPVSTSFQQHHPTIHMMVTEA